MNTFKGEMLEAVENAIVSFVCADGSALKVGQMLGASDVLGFVRHVRAASEAALGEGSVISWQWIDEQSAQVTASRSGSHADAVYRWEMGGGFDLDGDGELG